MPKKIQNTGKYRVDPKKFERATRYVEKYLLREFGTDDVGDPNVEFELVRRDMYQRLHYVPIPYWHKPFLDVSEEDAMEHIYRQAKLNMDIANGEFRLVSDIFADVRRIAKEKKHEKGH